MAAVGGSRAALTDIRYAQSTDGTARFCLAPVPPIVFIINDFTMKCKQEIKSLYEM